MKSMILQRLRSVIFRILLLLVSDEIRAGVEALCAKYPLYE